MRLRCLMGLVKCLDTGEKIQKELAYQVPTVNSKGKTVYKYYSSEKSYKTLMRDQEYRRKCTDLMMEYMNYKPGMKWPTITFKLLEEYKEPIGFDVLYQTLLSERKSIDYAFKNKQFTSETAKIQYLFAILQNAYMPWYRDKVARQRAEKAELQEDYNHYDDTRSRKQTVRNIRKFISDD